MNVRHGGLFALTIYDVMRRSRLGMTSSSIRESVVSRTGIPISQRKVRDYLRTLDYVGSTGGGYRVVRELAGMRADGSWVVNYRLVEAQPDGR